MKLVKRRFNPLSRVAMLVGSCAFGLVMSMSTAFAEGQQIDSEISTQDSSVESNQMNMQTADYTASKLIGMDVKDANDSDIGEIKDIGINWKDGQAAFVVLSAGGVMGVGGELYKVPFSKLSRSADGDYFTISMAEKDLKTEFSKFETRDEQQEKMEDHMDRNTDETMGTQPQQQDD